MLSVLVALVAMSVSACKPAQPNATVQAKRFELKGKVVSVDKAKKEVTVSHDDIVGYMPAMTMAFPLKDEWAFDVLAPGSTIGATLVVDANSFWLEGIVISASGNDTINTGAPGDSTENRIGQALPSFPLTNQDGKRINTQQYRGKVLLLTFVYTRCPLPDYCALMSNNFADLDKRFAAIPDLRNRTHLLSVTIDPAYDTPKVLRSYGAAYTGKYTAETFEYWEFATGSAVEIKRIAEFFGLTYFEEKQQITHSLRTAIIAPDGKVYKIYAGNDWNPAEAFGDVQKVLGTGGN